MRFKNILVVVNDINKSVKFYTELFGFVVLRDFDTKVILSDGLVLQDKKGLEEELGKSVSFGSNDTLLYFEVNHIEKFEDKLKEFDVSYNYNRTTDVCGRHFIRLYDYDGHLIEVGESFN